ncbi:hypothetical protein SAMN06269185_0032 [Natronoarchaeum philippinense]|uniref:Uncharacterized protein n=1 Tax=Natronoarchaeum philippinense TaxID=558529 RepID=A0A285MZ50_NATPI|nr:hypothetical protein [Natronoarchaeum philippinense]SNZ02479.1 hypothetical protein SAMN06269185_0032 [Natronoarchaeum philippinense]
MTDTELTTADRIAMLGGGIPIVLGVVVLGLINTFADAPPAPVVEEGTTVATPLIPVELRTGLVLLGLLVWLAYAGYKLGIAPGTGGAVEGTGTGQPR